MPTPQQNHTQIHRVLQSLCGELPPSLLGECSCVCLSLFSLCVPVCPVLSSVCTLPLSPLTLRLSHLVVGGGDGGEHTHSERERERSHTLHILTDIYISHRERSHKHTEREREKRLTQRDSHIQLHAVLCTQRKQFRERRRLAAGIQLQKVIHPFLPHQLQKQLQLSLLRGPKRKTTQGDTHTHIYIRHT